MISGDSGHLMHFVHSYAENTVLRYVYRRMYTILKFQFDFSKYCLHEWRGNGILDHKIINDNDSDSNH